jgi:flagellar hook-basal body complex protein FliE
MDPVRFYSTYGANGLHDLGQAASVSGKPGNAESPGDFLKALEGALDKVNSSQNDAAELSKKFQLNQDDVSLEETMVAIQKANIAFQAAVQVRNRLVSAYHDIMNMQI